MESFERYAGFFPEEAVTMLDRHVERPFPLVRPAGQPPRLDLAGGAWADAVLPDVTDGLDASRDNRSAFARWRDAVADASRRLRPA